MAITWILVANASLAKLYANIGPNKGLRLVKELMHPASRQRNAELVTDRAGSMASGSSKGVRQQQTLPKEHQAKLFAQEIARELYQGRASNSYRRAILVAPPGFMGMLNTTLDGPTSHMVSDRLEKDYTKTPEPQLMEHLASRIFL
jgi:protein required for attachment to host cells